MEGVFLQLCYMSYINSLYTINKHKKEKAMLKVEGLIKAYGNEMILKDLNFQIKENQMVGLLGPNGSGKTTLLKIINGLVEATSGKILFNDKEPNIDMKKHVAYLPERSFLSTEQTVIESIHYFRDFFEDFKMDKVSKLLELFEIDAKKRLSTLSKGQKGKVMLALTFARDADLYILDEPLDGVDPASREFILKVMLKYKKPNSTILISTHLIADIEDYLDYCLILKKGELIESDTKDHLTKKYNKTINNIFKAVFSHDEKII